MDLTTTTEYQAGYVAGVLSVKQWDESEHPRDKDGKFGVGGGESAPYVPDKGVIALRHLQGVESAKGSEIAEKLGGSLRDATAVMESLAKSGYAEKDFMDWSVTDKGKHALHLIDKEKNQDAEVQKEKADTHAAELSPDAISSGRVSLNETFDTDLAAASGRRVYSKRQTVNGVTLKLWEHPSDGEPRVYISGNVHGSTSGQSGSYDLGHVRYEGNQLMVAGGRDVVGMGHGIPAGEVRQRIHAVAKRMLAHAKKESKSLEEIDMTDTLVAYGGELKSLGETADGCRVGGYLVRFDSQDASNLKDMFTADTDFDFEDGDRCTMYFNHGLDPELKATKLGDGKLFKKDAGVWFDGIIKTRKDYGAKHIDKIIEGVKSTVNVKGIDIPVFGLSSGVPAHLVERKELGDGGHKILKWPLRTDASITPTPAEPLTACVSLKSLVEAEEFKTTMSTSEGYAPEVKPEEKKCPKCGAEMDGKHCSKCDYEMKYSPDQPRDDSGQWSAGGSGESAKGSEAGQHILNAINTLDNFGKGGASPNDEKAAVIAHLDKAKASLPEGHAAHEYIDSAKKRVAKTKSYSGLLQALGDAAVAHHVVTGREVTKDSSQSAFKAVEVESETEDYSTKSLIEIEAGLSHGLSLPVYSAKVRDAIAEARKHIEAFTDVRCVKSERRWSEANYAALCELAGSMGSDAEAVKALAEKFRPRDVEAERTEAIRAAAVAEAEAILAECSI